MIFFKKKKQINYLDMIPAKNITEFIHENGKVILLVPKFKKEWMSKFCIPGNKSKHIKVHLDENGTKVWEQINGEIPVRVICDKLRTENPADDLLELKITKYLSQLYKSRFIIFK